MAVHTKHPVAPAPAPPVREKTGHILLRGWCVFVLVAALGGTSWLMAFGSVGAGIVAGASAVVSILLWVVIRPAIDVARLPWLALLFVTWSVISVIWSAWTDATLLTSGLLVTTTIQGLFVASVLTWRELVRSIGAALKWVLGLSLVFELWVSLLWRGPILPGFVRPDGPVDDPIVLWSRDNLLDGGRIQGLFGNANALGYVALLGMIVFVIRIAARAPYRSWLIAWTVLSLFLFLRAGSATAIVAAVAVAVVAGTVLLMRTTRRPGERTRYYALYALVGAIGVAIIVFWREPLLRMLGRSADLTGRERIWGDVAERIAERPVLGWGYSTPWLPHEPLIDGWILDHGQTVLQAHNLWIDVWFQVGIIGLVLLAVVFFGVIWRAWFFAVDRPRWDLVADRPYSPITLVPTLTLCVLLVQSMAESTPLLTWGWMFLVMFAVKIAQSPLLGRGPSEQRLAGEQGERLST